VDGMTTSFQEQRLDFAEREKSFDLGGSTS
jgi:hypothetical protein